MCNTEAVTEDRESCVGVPSAPPGSTCDVTSLGGWRGGAGQTGGTDGVVGRGPLVERRASTADSEQEMLAISGLCEDEDE